MDMAEVLVVDAGWVFFAVWTMVLAAVGLIAFGQDILGVRQHESDQTSALGVPGARQSASISN